MTVERVGAGQEDSQRRLARPFEREQPLGDRCRHEPDGDPPLKQPVPEPSGVESALVIGEVHAGAAREIRPDLPDGGIEPWGRERVRPILPRYTEPAAL